MIGRDEELRHLVELADGAGTTVAMLAGEPGIGKTRLVRELLASMPPSATVLVGQAEPGSLGRPFELLLSAVDGRSDVDQAELDLLTDSSRTQVERLRTGLRILLRLTATAPAVVVFEDLHWADSESIALFERIADLEGRRLLVGTYRPAEVMRRNPIAGLLDNMERRHAVYHVRLERLGLPETSAFLTAVMGKPPPYRAAVSLHNRTGGNPFFLEELVRDGGDLADLCDQPLPWSLAEALRRQVEHLQPEHQRLVEAAAMLGYRIPFDLLGSVTGLSENDLIWALRELVSQGVLVETGEDEFAFRHALVREAVGERLLGRERRRLHEAALDALLAAGDADWALVAKHARGAGRYDDVLAAARAGSAAYLAMGSAFQALQLAEMGLEEVEEDAGLLATAANAAWLAGLLDDADMYARRWRAHAQTPDDAVAVLNLRIRVAWESGDNDAMAALSGELAAYLADLPSGPARARGMAMLAQSCRLRDLDDEALSWADQTVALTGELGGLAGVELAALVEKGALLAARADTLDEGRSLLVDVANRAEAAGEWLVAAFALNKLIHLPPSSSRRDSSWRDIADLLERMRSAAERAGSEKFAVAAYYQGRARMFMRKGNLASAIDAIQRGRAHDLGYRRSMTKVDFHGVFLAGLLLEATDLDAAAQVIADLTGVPGMEIGLPGLEFHLAARLGDVVRARALLPDVVAVVQSTGGRDGEFLHDLVSAALSAPLTPEEVSKLVDGLDGPTVEPFYRSLVAGQLAEANGDPAAALPHFVAATTSTELPPAARGTAHVGAARCLIAIHDLDGARTHANTAKKLLDRWSGWRVAQCDAVCRRLGLAGDAADSPQAPGLTPREREVARLIADGLTNVELAHRLYISPRTAAVHVSNILRKLGVASRTDVAGALPPS
jgi:DNA-binding CsgD family transcriptional regulator